MAFPLRLAGSLAPMVFAGLSMVGCGGSVAPDGGDAETPQSRGRSSSGVSGASSGSGTANPGVVRAPWCPSTVPDAGAACTPEMTLPGPDIPECEYGDDPHCTTTALCLPNNEGTPIQWTVTPPDPSCSGNSAYCPSPSAFPEDGTGCAGGTSCTYQSGRCVCLVCQDNTSSGNPCGQGASGTKWSCQGWEQPSGCPEPRPLLGTSCSVPMQVCGGSPDPLMKCVDRYWVYDE
jgi:hypothetical protein